MDQEDFQIKIYESIKKEKRHLATRVVGNEQFSGCLMQPHYYIIIKKNKICFFIFNINNLFFFYFLKAITLQKNFKKKLIFYYNVGCLTNFRIN